MAIKDSIRLLLGKFYYLCHYRLFRKKLDVDAKGNPLKPGITAVVAAKDEEYTIPLCLKSLIGVADQIVCIDNGSTDNTVREMEEFKRRHGDEIEVDIISLPGALLGDCRNAGLDATRHQWHFRCDADMICKTAGKESMLSLREEVLKDNTPRAIKLPRTNIIGDFSHRHKTSDFIDEGENFLIWYNRDLQYKEYGKFDEARAPIYYKLVVAEKSYILHCIGLKSVENLIHRFHYFTWRESYNRARTEAERETLKDFKKFVNKRNQYLFDTTDPIAVKWRYLRQLSVHFQKIDEKLDYPDLLKEIIEKGEERFKVVYKDGAPYTRLDNKDEALLSYKPTEEDLKWDMNLFFQRLKEEENNMK